MHTVGAQSVFGPPCLGFFVCEDGSSRDFSGSAGAGCRRALGRVRRGKWLRGADRGYALTLVAAERTPVRASNGMSITPDLMFRKAQRGYDLALVAGGPELPI